MAFDAGLAERIRTLLENEQVVERKMFGGLAFMVRGHMCVGVLKDNLMARVGADAYAESLQLEGASLMDFTGREMKGFVYVDAAAISEDAALQQWLLRCLDFVYSLPAK